MLKHDFIEVKRKREIVDWMNCEPFFTIVVTEKCKNCEVEKVSLPECLGVEV